MKLASVLLSFGLLFISIGVPTEASFRPSFSLDDCSWNATHILLALVTSSSGMFSVLKSLKGDLKPGDSLNVPELSPAKDAIPIGKYGFGLASAFSSQAEQIPKQSSGSQIILFLKRHETATATSPATKSDWDAASSWGGMKVSAVWIDAGNAYCFEQFNNPGPSALEPCISGMSMSSDAGALTARIQQVLRVQREMIEAMALGNLQLRAERLGRIARSDVFPASSKAIEMLGQTGAVALPQILQIMDQPATFYDGDKLIRVFAAAAGKDSGRQLHARLQQDVIYWKSVGPTLTGDWLGQLITVGSPLFMKFNETSLLVRELNREHYVQAAGTVAELRKFWISQPQLYKAHWGEDGRNGETRTNFTGQDQVRAQSFGLAKDCSAFLESVEEK